jgi:hypothetical protein
LVHFVFSAEDHLPVVRDDGKSCISWLAACTPLRTAPSSVAG